MLDSPTLPFERTALDSQTPALDSPAPAFERTSLAVYAQPRVARGVLDLVTSVVPYLALSVAMYFALDVSVLLTLTLALPASGFLVRTFIVFHDCTHGSLFGTKRANRWVGRVAGLLVLSPYERWRHDHAIHHATSGDLARRGVGDIITLTITESVSYTHLTLPTILRV